MRKWLRHIFLLPVYFYRYCISPFTAPSCRFTPTCSQYMVEAVMNTLEDKFATIRNGKGVAFAVPLSSVIGVNMYQFLSDNRMKRGE